MKDFDIKKLNYVTIEGVQSWDYPDLCDGFIAYAEYDGVELTEAECEWVEDNYPDEFYEWKLNSLI